LYFEALEDKRLNARIVRKFEKENGYGMQQGQFCHTECRCCYDPDLQLTLKYPPAEVDLNFCEELNIFLYFWYAVTEKHG
jgi:hypothetical protein